MKGMAFTSDGIGQKRRGRTKQRQGHRDEGYRKRCGSGKEDEAEKVEEEKERHNEGEEEYEHDDIRMNIFEIPALL